MTEIKFIYDWENDPKATHIWYRDCYRMRDNNLKCVAECFTAYIALEKWSEREKAFRCIVRPPDRYAEVFNCKTKEEALNVGREFFKNLGFKIVSPGAHSLK